MSVHIDEFEVDHGTEGNVTTWHASKEWLTNEAKFDGEYTAKILISLGVDGMFEVVSADLQRTGMRVALSEAIDALTRLYDAVRDVDLVMGQCIKHGDYGRCKAKQGDPCEFPTEAEMNEALDRAQRLREFRNRNSR